MYNLDTKEKIDFDMFLEILKNNELQVVSRKWTEEEKKKLSRDISVCKAMYAETFAKEEVIA